MARGSIQVNLDEATHVALKIIAARQGANLRKITAGLYHDFLLENGFSASAQLRQFAGIEEPGETVLPGSE
jgi:hypothetical protein